MEVLRDPRKSNLAVSALRELLVGYQLSQVLYVTARLNLADLLQERRSIQELARSTGADLDALTFLMRVLVGYGIFDRIDDEYVTNDIGRLLESGRPDSIRPTVVATGKERYHSWGDLLQTVRTGKPSFNQRHGSPLHDFYAAHPAAATSFNGAMAALTNSTIEPLLDSYDFARHSTAVEIGGGLGVFMTHILRANPNLRGIVLDLPHVVADATKEITIEDFGERLRLVAGDARVAVPENADLYIIKTVLCDFDDSDAISILRACRRAIASGGILVIFDKVRNDDRDGEIDRRTVLSALNLLVMTGGRERSVKEYRHLLARAGFEMVNIFRTEALDGEIHRVVAMPGPVRPLPSEE